MALRGVYKKTGIVDNPVGTFNQEKALDCNTFILTNFRFQL